MKNAKVIQPDVSWKDITPGGAIYDAGNAHVFITGDWRTMRPIYREERCNHCLLCAPVCPDSSIPVINNKRLDFDFDHCKGCGICVKVCPSKAIEFDKET
ncbi:MAG: 4Fe-4S binding protein [Bacillota bacterium]|jgi:pyruvate ferredoxin oxidoreductase delta subunit